jgi:Domain of Unknown Function (DUF1080)
MKKIICLLLFVLLIVCMNSYCQQNNIPPKTHPNTSGWSDLISSDLSNAEFPAGVWTFENGILTASKDECIWTKKEYNNCIIDLEFKNAESTNSGVIVYCTDIKNWIPNSVEIQILDDYGKEWKDAAKTWQCAAIFGHLAPSKQVVKPAGEWNHYTITCKGQMIWVMLNGELVTEMNMSLWTSAKKNPDGSEIPTWLSTPFARLATHGRIGLQGKHGGATIYFRNMKIKEL